MRLKPAEQCMHEWGEDELIRNDNEVTGSMNVQLQEKPGEYRVNAKELRIKVFEKV